MADDCKQHHSEPTYIKYMELFINANTPMKGDVNHMVMCEELFELYGTSSEEIRKKQEEKDMVLINAANAEVEKYRQKLIDHGIDPDA